MYTTKSYLGFESRSLRNEGSRSRKWPAAMIFLRRKLACKAAGKSLRPDGLQGPSAAPSVARAPAASSEGMRSVSEHNPGRVGGPSAAPSVARAPAASSEGMRSVSEHNPGRVGGHRLPHPLQGPLRRAVRECAASASTIPVSPPFPAASVLTRGM